MTRLTPRAGVMKALEAMPDEAFGWLLNVIGQGGIWPDGLGGFMPESRTAITEARAAVRRAFPKIKYPKAEPKLPKVVFPK